MKAIKNIISVFFPNTCPCCGDIIDEDDFLCEFCNEMIEKCDLSEICKNCGEKLSECHCNKYTYHFVACVSPYKNEGLAKKTIYDFKFRRRLEYADVFTSQMAIAVKSNYHNVLFDGVTYVPMPIKKRMRRGYNQSRILADKLSRILNIPLYDNMLRCKPSLIAQHNLNFKERFNNVKGLYNFCHRNCGETILLVDDIRTSGATLDECARQLLLSGCAAVYCVTGVVTEFKNNTKSI